ncbi:PAS domain S-box-containing protein/diguanylate cyclase (GGDEF) domain-containing protein [Franzmannia pantelleriensis]|uniref:PAS domain S-box-containing protein/diguanylate cyclase (GGDEF) domain-containing protein n=2 Tax=Franzmannia pantelleriensis TaxID=48727 RepID=A0A1G9VMP2_9GAMM|nr:PAS domain S-box-containing protein/diguanylate cyclase (GGDEF) domain-containing protein [Halomonas pantelleriensis]
MDAEAVTMQTPPLPGNETQRLQHLWRYTLHDRRRDAALDEVTRLAAELLDTPMATLSLVDEHCQWFKSSQGMPVDQTPRDISFCAHSILQNELMEVADTHLDPRFAANPQVTEAPFVRYYLGAPLLTRNGHALGSLCVLDTQPREASQQHKQILTLLARLVIQHFELGLDARFMTAVDAANIGVWELDVGSGTAFWSRAIYRQLGFDDTQPSQAEAAIARYHPDDQPQLRRCLRDACEQQRGFEVILRLMAPDGRYDWMQLNGEPLVANGETVQVLGTARNVNRLKRIEQRLQQQHQLDQVLVKAQSSFISSGDSHQAFALLLDDILALTESEFGFIGEVFHGHDGKPYLKIQSITDVAWDQAPRAMLDAAPDGLEFRNLDNLFGHALRTGQTVISNAPASDPRKGQLPTGHPPLKSFLGLPISLEGRVVAMLGLANRPGGYDDAMVEFLTPLLSTAAHLVDTLRVRREHQRSQQSIARLSQVAQRTSNSVFICDANDRIEWVNEGFEQLSGYSFREAHGKRPGQLLRGPATDPEANARIEAALARGEGFEEEVIHYRRDGTPYWVHIRCDALYDEQGELSGFIDIQSDISERKAFEERLKLAARVYDNTQEGILITDAEHHVVDVNPACCDITGYTRNEMIGTHATQLSSKIPGVADAQAVIDHLAGGEDWHGEFSGRRKNGESYPAMLSVSAVYDDSGELLNHVAVFSDLTRTKRHHEELFRAANFDKLTGLANRDHLTQKLQDLLDYAEGYDQSLTVCMLDLDRFGNINQVYGHQLADRLLVALASRLQALMEEQGKLARVGGDEFALILPESHQRLEFLEHLRDALAKPLIVDNETLSVTASIGVSTYPQDDSDADMLLRHATQAMYQAKQRGGDCYQLFDADQDLRLRRQRDQLNRLARALDDQEFELYYQPQVDLAQQRVVGVEALIRWRHPQRGLLAPGHFLPLLAGTELEQAIDEWVLETALRQSDAWRHAGMALPISVNLSPQSLVRREFLDVLAHLMQQHPQIGPGDIKVEVLESAALDDIDAAMQVMEGCQALGIELALDDFGTGYSSLSYLRNLPVDLIKIDRSFVSRMLESDDDHAIVESVIFLAGKFNRPVLAEGVESMAHARALGALGCHLMQGYGIARPMPAAEIPAWQRSQYGAWAIGQ